MAYQRSINNLMMYHIINVIKYLAHMSSGTGAVFIPRHDSVSSLQRRQYYSTPTEAHSYVIVDDPCG